MIPDDYVQGLLYDFRPYSITYTLIKMAVFAFIITSISAFYGYYAKGNSLEVGAASTKAVVASSIVIMIFNLILTQLLPIRSRQAMSRNPSTDASFSTTSASNSTPARPTW